MTDERTESMVEEVVVREMDDYCFICLTAPAAGGGAICDACYEDLHEGGEEAILFPGASR